MQVSTLSGRVHAPDNTKITSQSIRGNKTATAVGHRHQTRYTGVAHETRHSTVSQSKQKIEMVANFFIYLFFHFVCICLLFNLEHELMYQCRTTADYTLAIYNTSAYVAHIINLQGLHHQYLQSLSLLDQRPKNQWHSSYTMCMVSV